MQRLVASVGQGGANHRSDVLTIQGLINQCIGFIVPRAFVPVSGHCDSILTEAIQDFQGRVVKLDSPDGRVDPGGKTFNALIACASGKPYQPNSPSVPVAPAGPGHIYTKNPLEVATTRTTPTAGEVVAAVRQSWPELTANGARTLAAQFMHETGSGKYCFNWNLGNVKSGPNDPHMYLHGVWEVDSPAKAQSQVDNAGGLAHLATAEEIRKHGWGCPEGKAIAVFDPPHPQSRFRAYASLQDGAQRWVAHHQATAKKRPDFVTQLNSGDCAAVAKTLKGVGYYTGSESDYARNMTSLKAQIDKQLGAP